MPLNDLRKGRYSEINREYFVTFTTKNRTPKLEINECANVVARTIHYSYAIENLAWVIMPDHVHMLFSLKNGNLSSVISFIKASSSKEIAKTSFPFNWAPGFYDHALRNEESRIDIARYIVANPLRARIVKSLKDYPWWDSAYL